MKGVNLKKIMAVAVIGSIVVAAILVLGMVWSGRSASRDTEQAVRNVSLLYLEELAGRREQVVASTLSDYISDLDVAVGLITPDDLSSTEKLQAYQLRMKQLYGLEKFAFVDENGLIYTSRGTRTDIDQYGFDYKTLSEPEISLKNENGEDIKVVVAMPTDQLSYGGQLLVVCFMEIDIQEMLDTISLRSGSNNTTFCNLYTKDGISLTKTVLGGLSNEESLLTALNNAEFEKGYNIENIKKDFSVGTTGVASFTYNNIKETMYYVPVHRTDWMLTYLIRESVISSQIDAISKGIIMRSFGMALITTLVLIGVFTVMLIQTRKAAKLSAEKETSEVMQQELEERIALQDELLEQEKQRARLDKMINALASDYRSVYYVNLDKDMATCFRKDSSEGDNVAKDDVFSFSKAFSEYGNSYVAEDYRKQFLDFIKPENIREALKSNSIIAFRYLVKKGDNESYEMLRMADVNNNDKHTADVINAVGVGFTDIDEEMRDSLAKNQALSDALKTAEEASRAKTVFLSSMSHEIRTPMNAIIGLDSLALNEPDISETTKDYLEKIGSSAQHLLSLINDILDMSRIESGRMTLKNEEFAFSKMLEQINVIFSGQCKEKGLEYNCRLSGHLNDYYIGDSVKLRQVLINILGNAVKFTPEGGKIDFTVEKKGGFNGKTALQFKISDTGIGMSEEYLPKIFDTFSQENAGSTNKYGSSGLGMAITKRIVDMMNGEILVESAKGVGTTFYVNVTLKDSARKLESDNDTEIHPNDMKVLVIDDDPLACDHAKLVMSQVGIETDIAKSGSEALEMVKLSQARQEPYNLIIVDWQMPEMDGLETTKQIRALIGQDTAVIILTAYNWDDIYEEATQAGVDSFIAKPLFTENLINEFKNVLQMKREFAKGIKTKAALEGRHILLAEDIEVNAQIMLKVLSMRGIEADHAINGKAAVDLYDSKPEGYYDAVLMDMRMPLMDGLTASKIIRSRNKADSLTIPIIALTANAFDEDVQQSLQAGLNAHLSKPVEPAVLFDTLEKLIDAG